MIQPDGGQFLVFSVCLLLVSISDLNPVDEGGSTSFPRLKVTQPPERGRGLLWLNGNSDGSLDSAVVHKGDEVKKGRKLCMNVWFTQRNGQMHGDGIFNPPTSHDDWPKRQNVEESDYPEFWPPAPE
jgi:hypothetical protein